MALENKSLNIENKNRNIEELTSRLNNPYLKEFLEERVNSKLGTIKKNEFLTQFSTLSLQEKITYSDYLSKKMKESPIIINGIPLGILENIDKLEILSLVYNNINSKNKEKNNSNISPTKSSIDENINDGELPKENKEVLEERITFGFVGTPKFNEDDYTEDIYTIYDFKGSLNSLKKGSLNTFKFISRTNGILINIVFDINGNIIVSCDGGAQVLHYGMNKVHLDYNKEVVTGFFEFGYKKTSIDFGINVISPLGNKDDGLNENKLPETDYFYRDSDGLENMITRKGKRFKEQKRNGRNPVIFIPPHR